jgi:hypothetical protein
VIFRVELEPKQLAVNAVGGHCSLHCCRFEQPEKQK